MLFFLILRWCIFNNFSWSGLFVFCDSYVFILLIYIMLYIYGLVVIRELNRNLVYLSGILILICFFFFLSTNMLMLYIFYELSLFPILVIILGFGSQIEKIGSSYYLLFYTTFCSLPFLYVYYKRFFYLRCCFFDFVLTWELLFVLSLRFMVKFPVYFLHLWLPKAHVEAPTTARILLAGLLLKLGTAGFLRIMGSINFSFLNFWVFLSLIGIVLSSFCCLFQRDSKSLAAYSSVTHMGFLLLSLRMIIVARKTSGLILMLAHGYTSTLMFYVIGEFYHTKSTRIMYFLSRFIGSSLMFAVCFFLVFLSNSGVPPSMSFFSEFIIIVSVYLSSKLFFVIVFLYFLVAFYYSVYLIVCSSMGKMNINLNNNVSGFIIFLLVIMFNIFWLSIFY